MAKTKLTATAIYSRRKEQFQRADQHRPQRYLENLIVERVELEIKT